MEVRSFNNDLNFGLEKELEIIDILKLNFDDEVDIRNTKDIYNDEFYIYDFEAKSGTTFELKSRRVKKNDYPTTIVPVSKVRDTDKKQLFIFNFTDACCSIEYDKEVWSKFLIKDVSTWRFGKIDIPKPHYHIPVNLLEDLLRTYNFPARESISKNIPIYVGANGGVEM